MKIYAHKIFKLKQYIRAVVHFSWTSLYPLFLSYIVPYICNMYNQNAVYSINSNDAKIYKKFSSNGVVENCRNTHIRSAEMSKPLNLRLLTFKNEDLDVPSNCYAQWFHSLFVFYPRVIDAEYQIRSYDWKIFHIGKGEDSLNSSSSTSSFIFYVWETCISKCNYHRPVQKTCKLHWM